MRFSKVWICLVLILLNLQVYAQKPIKAVLKDGKWGFVKKNGKFLLEPVYDSVYFGFENDVAGVGIKHEGKYLGGLINKKGDRLCDFKYLSLDVQGNYIVAENQNYFLGILNWDGAVSEGFIYKKIEVKDNFLNGESFDSWEIFNSEGKIISNTPADSVSFDNACIYAWRNGNKSCLLNPVNGKTIQEIDLVLTSSLGYEEKSIHSVSNKDTDTLFVFKEDAWYGYVDSSGKIRISIQYDSVKSFSEGLAPVKILGKWAYINRKEKFIIQPSFDDAWPFKNGSAMVKVNGKYNFINKNGELRNGKGFDMVEKLETGNFMIRSGNSIGLADPSGKEMVIPKYEDLEDLGNGYVIVKKHGLLGVLNYQQDIIVPCQYLSLRYLNNYFAAGKSGSPKICKRLFD